VVQDDTLIDKYETYEELFDPAQAGRNARRPKANQRPKRTKDEIVAGLTDDTSDVELGFSTTYRPSRHESGWLLSSLYPFYDEGLITDVLALIKGGKEANVYRCQATAAAGGGMLAAKVYRPRMFRNLRNDKMYRQGREILLAEGAPAGRSEPSAARPRSAWRRRTRRGSCTSSRPWSDCTRPEAPCRGPWLPAQTPS
jgi:RIO kinase 1